MEGKLKQKVGGTCAIIRGIQKLARIKNAVTGELVERLVGNSFLRIE